MGEYAATQVSLKEAKLEWILDHELKRNRNELRLWERAILALFYNGVRLVHKIHVKGRDNIPREKGFFSVLNHLSNWDIFLGPTEVMWVTNKFVYGVGKIEVFTELPFVSKLPFWPRVVAYVGVMPLPRGKTPGKLFRTGQQLISGNKIFMIAPEGTRSKSGRFLEFKQFTMFLRGNLDTPVLPMGMMYDPLSRAVYINIGKPIIDYQERFFPIKDGKISYSKQRQLEFVDYVRDIVGSLYTVTYPHLACNSLVQAVEQKEREFLVLDSNDFRSGLMTIVDSIREEEEKGYYLDNILKSGNPRKLEKVHARFVNYCLDKKILFMTGEGLGVNVGKIKFGFEKFEADFEKEMGMPKHEIPNEVYSKAMSEYKEEYPIPFYSNQVLHLDDVVGIVAENVESLTK